MVDEVVIPDNMAMGFSPAFDHANDVMTLGNGHRVSNKRRTAPQRVYTCSYDHLGTSDYQEIAAFVLAQEGSNKPFLLKDWADFSITDGSIGTGDGSETEFQIVKTYSNSANSHSRTIKYIKSGTLVVKVNDVEVDSEDYTEEDGLITFDTAPTNGHAVTVSCEFYVPVRLEPAPFSFEVTGPTGNFARVGTFIATEELE